MVKKGDLPLYAFSAYVGSSIEKVLTEKEIANQIHKKGYRHHPLTSEQKEKNHVKSKIRVRVEHIFGQMTKAMHDGLKMRGIGLTRIATGVGMLNLVYNLTRYEQIGRLKPS